jgi:anti-anti-sigma factor
MKQAASALQIDHRELGPTISVISLAGKLMLGPESARLHTLVGELLDKGFKNFVFDMAGITHIDSTGIGRFIDAYARIGKIGGEMRLAGATGAVRDAFRVTRLDTVFKFFPDVDAASQGMA